VTLKSWPAGEVRRIERAFSPKYQHFGFYMLRSFVRRVPSAIEGLYAHVDMPVILVERGTNDIFKVLADYTYEDLPDRFKDERGQYPRPTWANEDIRKWDRDIGMVTGFPLRPWIRSKLNIPCTSEEYYQLKSQVSYENWVYKTCDSPIERQFAGELIKRGLRLTPQKWVAVGSERYKIDFADDTHKLAVELDGHDFHKTREQRTNDAKRERALQSQGWTVIRFTGSEVFQDTAKCVDELVAIWNRGRR